MLFLPTAGTALPWFTAVSLLALVLALAALTLGPVEITPERVLAAIAGRGAPADVAIVGEIRLPRLLLGIAVGASLAMSGAALQGMLRNPLADPGLIGVTAGASLGAVAVIVLGDVVAGGLPQGLRPWLLPIAAFAGGGIVIGFVLALARRSTGTPVATLILAGVAINAIASAGIGALVYLSDDRQLRDLTFWSMGALGGAGWDLAAAAALLAALALPILLIHARALDLMQLGEQAAFHAGLDTERVKRRIALATALGIGAVTAAAGPIGFIGLVAPHLARLVIGPAHGLLLPAAGLMGVVLVLAADLAVRLVVPPAEPPIGLATSLIGGPFFLWLLLRRAPSSNA
ncbi:iron ABC transporter permease [Limibaculum sp. M0105]|uniref:Iron ABC transporter permease n=1 Tax=Thermohalobaculum xanthum TaxID=2753746 RepID=A0A8J7M4N4_9RHOB|nr:iron ABC transporter permease [Thermohalobaculum xanthum]MBK0398254.1 iron ABC transporter permease [Thermohalobaculum xanthum]